MHNNTCNGIIGYKVYIIFSFDPVCVSPSLFSSALAYNFALLISCNICMNEKRFGLFLYLAWAYPISLWVISSNRLFLSLYYKAHCENFIPIYFILSLVYKSSAKSSLASALRISTSNKLCDTYRYTTVG